MELYDHFCDYQIKRFLLQLVRGFSGFQYKTGARGTVPAQFKVVPVMLAKRSRQAAAILTNGSENVVNAIPIITIDHTGLRPDPERLQNTSHTTKSVIRTRKKDVNGNFTSESGDTVTVERLMPRPFTIEAQIDIWTSNMDQKHQLMEQILTVIYPTFSIQNSDNAIDWSALSEAHVKDVTWTSSSYPIGSDAEIEVSNITMEIPIWLNPPAKITRSSLVEKVITNINDTEHDNTVAKVVVTPGNHHIKVDGTSITLLGPHGNTVDSDGEEFSWDKLSDSYKRPLVPATTQIRLKYEKDGNEIIGLYQGSSGNVLQWQPVLGSLPSNTLPAVNAVIDPRRSYPNDGTLPSPTNGQRYLLIADLPPNTDVWGAIGANMNTIIERVNGAWQVVFTGNDITQYLVNLHTNKQLVWINGAWRTAMDGVYSPEFWSLV